MKLNCRSRIVSNVASRLLWAMVLIGFTGIGVDVRAFQHPGIPLTVADLNNEKTNLVNSPWSDGYAALVADGKSSTNYIMAGPFGYANRNLGGNYDNENAWKNDMQAVFNLSRMWCFTGNTNYAQKGHDSVDAGGSYPFEPSMGNILCSAYVTRKGLTTPWMLRKRYAIPAAVLCQLL